MVAQRTPTQIQRPLTRLARAGEKGPGCVSLAKATTKAPHKGSGHPPVAVVVVVAAVVAGVAVAVDDTSLLVTAADGGWFPPNFGSA